MIFWDRIFGTFQKEDAKCIYGTKTPLNSWNPLKVLGIVYYDIIQKVCSTKGILNKLRAFYKNLSWLSGGANIATNPSSDIAIESYNPPVRNYGYFFATGLLVVAFIFACFLMIAVDELSYLNKVAGLIVILSILYCASFFMESKETSYWIVRDIPLSMYPESK